MPHSVDFQPVVGHHLATRHRSPYAIDEDLAAAARKGAQAGGCQPFKDFLERPL